MAPFLVGAALAALASAQPAAPGAPPAADAVPDLAAAPATPEERWSVRIAAGYRAAVLDAEGGASGGGGYDLRVEAGRFLAAASGEATIGPDRLHALLLGGAGFSRPLSRRLAGHALLVGGTHWMQIEEPHGPGWQDHLFAAAGVRVGVHRFWGRGRILAFGALEATMLRDLWNERDAFRGRVGGWSAMLSFTADLGLGFGRRHGQARAERPTESSGLQPARP